MPGCVEGVRNKEGGKFRRRPRSSQGNVWQLSATKTLPLSCLGSDLRRISKRNPNWKQKKEAEVEAASLEDVSLQESDGIKGAAHRGHPTKQEGQRGKDCRWPRFVVNRDEGEEEYCEGEKEGGRRPLYLHDVVWQSHVEVRLQVLAYFSPKTHMH